MKNKIKILVNIISAVMLFILVLPLVLSLLLNVNFIQNIIVRKLSEVATEALGSKVSIEKVDIKLFYRASVEGFYVEDPTEGDTLMYVNKVSARLKNFDFTSGVNFDYAIVDSGCIYLNNDSTLTINIKHITDKLKSENPKKGFKLNIDDIDIKGFDFEYKDVVRMQPKEYGINYQDMRFEDVHIAARDFKLDTDSINMSVDSLGFTEKTGFELINISAENLRLSSSEITVSDADIHFEHSHVSLKQYTMKYHAWTMFDYVNKVVMGVDIVDCEVDFRDIAKFTPVRQPWTSVIRFSGNLHGTIADMKANIYSFSEQGTTIDSVRADIKGLPDIKKCIFDVDISGAKSSIQGFESLYKDFTGKTAPFFSKLSMLTSLDFNGVFNGSFSDFTSKGVLVSNFGSMNLNLINKPVREGMKLRGGVKTKEFMIGKMFKIPRMNNVSLDANMDALIGNDTLNVVTKAKILSLDYNDYLYSDIDIDGNIVDKTFYGYLGCRDENIDFDFNGAMEFGIEVPRYDFSLNAVNINLAALNFNKRDSVSLVSMRLKADGSGLKLDNMNGSIEIDSLKYINPVDTVVSGRIVYTTRNSENSKLMRFNSDFADIELQGKQSYSNIFKYLINTVQKYLPSLQEGMSNLNKLRKSKGADVLKIAAKDENIEAAENSYYIATMNVKKVNNVAGIFIPGLEVAEGTKLSFMFNPAINEFSFTFNSDFISRKNMFLSNINIDSKALRDSISIYARSKEMIFNNIFIPNFLLMGGVKDNSVNLDARFLNENDKSEALLSTRSLFERDENTGELRLKVNILPSRFSLDGHMWSAASSTILLDTSGINIPKFVIYSNNQMLTVWGDISSKRTDTLNMDIANFNIAPFSKISGNLGFELGGTVDGRVSAVSLFKEPHFVSKLTFKGVSVNDRVFDDAVFTSGWSESKRSLTFSLRQDGKLPLIDGAYRPLQKIFYADINIKDVDLSLISPFMTGISHDTRGAADVSVKVSNPKEKLRVDGEVDIHNFETTIDFTNVRYSAKGHVDILENNFKLTEGTLSDEMGANCVLQGEVNGKNFKNVDYSLTAFPSKMLCMNTTISDNDVFYGRLFCSGELSIVGHGTNVVMNVNATSENNSTFFMPLSSKSTMKEADFIKFASRDSMSVENQKRSFIMRQQKAKLNKNVGVFTMNMNLHIQPNLEAQIVIDPTVGDIIKGRGLGDLKIYAQPLNDIFSMYGGVEIIDGSYLFTLQNIINKYFKIKEGSSINWNGDPLDAKLNITATYLVKTSLAPLLGNDPQYSKRVDVDCNLNLTGQLLRPDINLGISVPYAEPEIQSLVNSVLNTEESVSTQIFWLLFANTFYADSNNASTGVNSGLTTGAAVTGLEFLSNQISNWISNDKFNLGFSYRPKGDLTSDELELRVSAPLLKDKLSLDVDGNYNFKNNQAYITENLKSFSANASLTWLIRESSNLTAKAFTRQINTFDENQGLQETGVGIYYKDDFNRFHDLIVKYRKNKKERLQTKEVKRNMIDSIGIEAYRAAERQKRYELRKNN